MTPFAFSGLLTGINCSILAIISSIYGRSKLHLILFLFNIAVALWGFGCLIAGIASIEPLALFGWKLAHTGGFFISILYFHLTCIFCNIHRKPLLIFGYIQAIIFNWLCWFQGNLITKTRLVYGIYYNDATFLYYFGVLSYLILVAASFYELLMFFKKSKDLNRTRTLYMCIAFLFGFIGGTSVFLSEFKIDIAYPFGNFGISLYPIIMTYAIFKYNLMEINIIIRRSLIYSLLISSITIMFLISVLISERLFHQIIHYQNVTTSIIMASLIALVFTPLKNKIQTLVDRAFFKATPIEMAQQNEQLRKEVTHSERMKSIAILASGMAHEIKNPLTPIKTFSEQLPSRLDDKEFLLKFSRIINKEVDRIDSLVQELLNFAKPSSPELKEVNIHQLIEHTLDLLNNEIIRHKINLNTSFENKNILINIDPQQIKQAFLNIFLNAIEAMPNGGILTVNTNVIVNPSSGVIASEAKQSLIIEVTDTGCGIPPKDLPHIFDPFFSKKDHGTGLGLSITHEIIKNHNGKIVAESELGKGTTFKIELPL